MNELPEGRGLGFVLAAVGAMSEGEPIQRVLDLVCQAAAALGAPGASVVVRNEGESERTYGPETTDETSAVEFTADDASGRLLVPAGSGWAPGVMRGLASLAALAVQSESRREALSRRALRDPLTGLVNRLGLDDLLRRDVERAHRAGADISVVVLDLDRLERINEASGRDAGDEAIAELAEILRAGLRMVDVAARLGGGEFCAVLPGASTENAREVAERLRCAVAAANVPGVGTMTATFGVAALKEHAANGVALLQAAEAAMATGKRRGRNRVDVAVSLNRV